MGDRLRSRARGVRVGALVAAAAAGMAALPAPAAAAPKATALVYMVRGNQLQAVPRPVRVTPSTALATLRWLRAGPTAKERKRGIYSAVDARLRVVRVKKVGNGVAVVYAPRGVYLPDQKLRLNVEASSRLRLAQIVYTLTEFPSIRKVTVVTTGRKGTQVRVKGLTRRTFRLSTGKAPSTPLPPWKGPRPGDITSIQKGMRTLRWLAPDGVSGVADYRTQQALYAFQGYYGLERTGTATRQTVARLRALTAPPRPRVRSRGKHVEVYRGAGVALLVANGRVVRAVHVSTGAGGATPSGSFSVFRKERMSWSIPFSVWMPYASYFVGGIAFHAYPDVPPWPASHGCIRTSAPEAAFVYGFLDYGTRVLVY